MDNEEDYFGEWATWCVSLQHLGRDKCPSCGSAFAVVKKGSGPHRAGLRCRDCDRHSGWVSNEQFEKLLNDAAYLSNLSN